MCVCVSDISMIFLLLGFTQGPLKKQKHKPYSIATFPLHVPCPMDSMDLGKSANSANSTKLQIPRWIPGYPRKSMTILVVIPI